MAEAAKRATANTTLVIERVEVPIGLYTTSAKPGKLTEFTTAGPNGGVLETEAAAAVKPLSNDEPMESSVQGDPLADDPGSDAPPVSEEPAAAAPAPTVPGEFKRYLIEQGTGERVEPAQVRRGVRLEDGSFVDCTPQLRLIEEETKLETMEVVGFIDVGQVERARIESSYYIGASVAASAKPLKLIYEALRIKRRAAVVRWTSRARQSLGVLVAHGNTGTLVALKLVWAEDWREAPAKAVSVSRAQVETDEVRMACDLVDALACKAADTLDTFRDEAIVMREELYAQALAGEVEAVPEPAPAPEGQDVGLMAAIEASLAELRAPAGKV
jgi:non-homologous end joining protein Ku